MYLKEQLIQVSPFHRSILLETQWKSVDLKTGHLHYSPLCTHCYCLHSSVISVTHQFLLHDYKSYIFSCCLHSVRHLLSCHFLPPTVFSLVLQQGPLERLPPHRCWGAASQSQETGRTWWEWKLGPHCCCLALQRGFVWQNPQWEWQLMRAHRVVFLKSRARIDLIGNHKVLTLQITMDLRTITRSWLHCSIYLDIMPDSVIFLNFAFQL